MDLKTYFQNNSQVDLAKTLGVTAGAVNQWVSGLSQVSAERCPAIEKATGGLVRCEDLRPDVQWAVLRGQSSELAQSPTHIPQPAAQAAGQGV